MTKEDVIILIENVNQNPLDNKAFQETIKAFSELGFSASDISLMFGITTPSVKRWIEGRAAPHPNMRKAFCRTLLKKIQDA